MFEKILVPTDFSRYSQNVLECISELPGNRDVVLLNVIHRTPISRSWDPASEVENAHQNVWSLYASPVDGSPVVVDGPAKAPVAAVGCCAGGGVISDSAGIFRVEESTDSA